ncbi:helix-turn-helix domain-containing protein [Termitidicoccus mucosus]|uniref:Uncharacterized protein n=1 Tax=Termitidicoccus mucosus TaxID=1184151 RepID=A0A178IN17_9BACT|nr:hypothetical protein AW736_03945 [Opitutaceae bacterium TSB47]
MSHISTALQELTRGRRQQDIADAAGMPRTTFTQYRLAIRPPTVEVVEQLLRAFGEEEQRVLVRAYLDDETPASWFGRVRIEFPGRPQKRTKAAGAGEAAGLRAPEDKALSEALTALLARARRDNEVRQVVLDLAAMCSRRVK